MENNSSLPLNKLVDLDKLIHERVRLGIMSALAGAEEQSFNDLKRILDVTDGNLARHLRILEENQYISVEKKFVARRPKTTYRLTDLGRDAFKIYINQLEKLVKDIQLD